MPFLAHQHYLPLATIISAVSLCNIQSVLIYYDSTYMTHVILIITSLSLTIMAIRITHEKYKYSIARELDLPEMA